MLMIVCPEGREEEVRRLIARHEVHAYSEVRDVAGEGQTGLHMGNRVFPGSSAIIFTVVPAEKKQELLAALREYAKSLYPSEGMRTFVLPVEEMV